MHQVLGQQLYPIKSNEHKISHWSLYNNSTKQEYPTLIYIYGLYHLKVNKKPSIKLYHESNRVDRYL